MAGRWNVRSKRATAATIGLLLVVTTAACGSSPPTPSPTETPAPTPAPPTPLTPADVEPLLQTLDGTLRLVPTTQVNDVGSFPELAFDGRTETVPADFGPHVGLVLVFPTVADRVAMQPYFGWSGISGPRASVIADGITHSEWIGFENVLVEAVMPGGTMGGREPTRIEAGFPDRVRNALGAAS
jgi:hypothetical protein